jgi:hypothetical protein
MPKISIGEDHQALHHSQCIIERIQIANQRATSVELAAIFANPAGDNVHMSEHGMLFSVFEDDVDSVPQRKIYTRPPRDIVPANLGETELPDNHMPVKVVVFQKGLEADGEYNHQFMLDDMRLNVSGIRWEFSGTGADDDWHSMKDTMNAAMTHFTLPTSTSTIYVRASGHGTEDWIASYVIEPVPERGITLAAPPTYEQEYDLTLQATS